MLGQERLLLALTESGVDVKLERLCCLDQSNSLSGCSVGNEYFLSCVNIIFGKLLSSVEFAYLAFRDSCKRSQREQSSDKTYRDCGSILIKGLLVCTPTSLRCIAGSTYLKRKPARDLGATA